MTRQVRPEREKTMYQLGRVLYDLRSYDRSKLLFEQVRLARLPAARFRSAVCVRRSFRGLPVWPLAALFRGADKRRRRGP